MNINLEFFYLFDIQILKLRFNFYNKIFIILFDRAAAKSWDFFMNVKYEIYIMVSCKHFVKKSGFNYCQEIYRPDIYLMRQICVLQWEEIKTKNSGATHHF